MMRYRHLYAPIIFLLAASQFGKAQQVITINSATLYQHVLTQAPLSYPAIARAAHVQGTVVLRVQVGPTGKVESTETSSGPPLLIQAATDSVKEWTFRPFEKNGSPIQASSSVSLVFTLSGTPAAPREQPEKAGSQRPPLKIITIRVKSIGPDDKVADRFFDTRRECDVEMGEKKRDEATAKTCKDAADIAEQLRPNGHYIDKRFAFITAATALYNAGDLNEALVYAKKAVNVTKLGHDIDAGSSEAYATTGSIEFFLGDLSAADRDLTRSEDYGRKAIAWARKEAPNDVESYKGMLGQELRIHSKVSSDMDHSAEAKSELAEASNL
jgi:TonB family protein